MNQQNNFFKKIVTYCFLVVATDLYCAEQASNSNRNQFLMNIGYGASAGCVESLANQWLVFLKNSSQQQKDVRHIIRHSPSTMYNGLGISMACMAPATAAQISVSEVLKDQLPGDDLRSASMRSMLAGVSSGLICNFTELVVIQQQNNKANTLSTIKHLHAENGMRIIGRGAGAKVGRDAPFCVGFLMGYPRVKKRLQEEHNLSDMPATVLATALVGPITALVSHPFDTISTNQQADPSRKRFGGFVDTAQKLTASESKTLLLGFPWRLARVTTAIPIMHGVTQAMHNMIDQQDVKK